ncbi:MAG: LuxR C-terminal-related transcriptional regulator [Actinomycetota bacterium]
METRTLEIVGRDHELAAITTFLDATGRLPAALLIEGDAGIGKTSLCTAALAHARERGFEPLVARPAAAEAELALSGIGDLLEHVLDRVLAELPGPQARALRIALLLDDDGSAPEARALGVAFLGALRVLAVGKPVFVLVDDVQWLDSSSAAVLRFAARRLVTEPVGLVLARRAGHTDDVVPGLGDVERLVVGGLSTGALHRLLRQRLQLLLPRPALLRLHELSGGNPFYALELGRAFQDGTIRLEAGEALPTPLDALVGRRIAALPERSREALAAAAALSRPTVALVGSLEALAPAVEAKVVVLERDEIRFTHPLLASAAYSALAPDRKRDLHRRLAREVAGVEERARHHALAAEGPDEAAAAELELAAESARSRGAVTAAAGLAEHSLALTPAAEDEARDRRTLLAARFRFESGDMMGPRKLLEKLVAESPRGSTRAQALADLARVHMFSGARRKAVALLRDALEAADEAWLRAIIEERLTSTLAVLREDLQETVIQARSSVRRAEDSGDPRVLARALAALGVVGGVVGDSDAEATLERAVQLERYAGYFASVERPAFNLAAVLMWSDQLDRARSLFARLYAETADAGDDSSLAWTADNLANLEFLAGNWETALRWAEEGNELAVQTGQPGQQAYAKATKALVHAHRGDDAAARETAREALELSGDEVAIGWMNARWALGVLELSLGQPAAAHEQLGPLCEHVEKEGIGEPGTTRFVFDDIEALISLGRVDEAETRLACIEAHARRLDRTFALAASARSRGLLAAFQRQTAGALEAFEQALSEHARGRAPFDRARTLLAYGSALRRARRRREAREALEDARQVFAGLGAAVWAERAREELGRVGGRAPAGDELTPTERKVAELAAKGLPNREIASALFVTPKTVEFHLRNVFRKLDVRSRGELARRTP